MKQTRKRGGQSGNQNARTHGFYSRHLTPEQQEILQEAGKLNGLDQEIALMRLKIDSILANAPRNHHLLIQAVNSLSRLLKAKQFLRRSSGEGLAAAVQNVFRDIIEPLGLSSSPDAQTNLDRLRFSFVYEKRITLDLTPLTMLRFLNFNSPKKRKRISFILTCPERSRGSLPKDCSSTQQTQATQ